MGKKSRRVRTKQTKEDKEQAKKNVVNNIKCAYYSGGVYIPKKSLIASQGVGKFAKLKRPVGGKFHKTHYTGCSTIAPLLECGVAGGTGVFRLLCPTDHQSPTHYTQ